MNINDQSVEMKPTKVNVSHAIERIGFGKLHVLAVLAIGLRSFTRGSQECMLAIVEPYLRCHWNLSFLKAAMIVLPEGLIKIVASPIVGKLADIYGRRSMLQLLYALQSFLSLLNLFSSSVQLLAITRAAIGFESCCVIIDMAYLMEILPSSGRKFLSTLAITYVLGSIYSITAATLSFQYLNWRWYIAFAEVFPLAIAFICVSWLPESPRYLSVTGQDDKAMLVLERICKINGVEPGYTTIVEIEESDENSYGNYDFSAKEKNCISKWEITKRIGLISLIQLTGAALSQTVRFGSMQLAENSKEAECQQCSQHLTYKYIWAIDSGLLLSSPLIYISVRSLKRITAYKTLFILLILSFAPFYFKISGWYLIIATFIICLVQGVYNTTSSVYESEVLPTYLRGYGSGISGTFAQCGFLFGQFLSLYLQHINTYISYGLIHGLLIAGLIASFTIFTETKEELLRDF